MQADPGAVVAVDVGAIDGTEGAVVERIRSLLASGQPGTILVTDVVRQLYPDAALFEPVVPLRPLGGDGGRVHRMVSPARHPVGLPTIGRDVELASIDWLLAQLGDGSGRALTIEGEAGIGKSHLVAVAAARAESHGAMVVRAEADELRPDQPGLLLGRLLQQLDPAHDVADPGPSAVTEFCDRIERAAMRTPLVVMAEDLQWADPLTLRAIAAAARIILPLPVGLIVDFRPAPRPPLLAPLLDVLDRAGAEHHVLEAFDAEATSSLVAALLGAAPGPSLRARLLATAGNPLFVTETLEALRTEDALQVDNGIVDTTATDMPLRLRDTVLRRLESLPGPAADLLVTASLLGSSFDLADLEAAVGEPPDAIEELLRPAIDARLLEPTPCGFAFRHDLVRTAVHDSLPDSVRARRHREIGWRLADVGAAPVVVASQLVLGDRSTEPPTLEWLERAARAARTVDPGSARQLYELLLERAPTSWPGRELAETALIEVLASTGEVDDAIARARLLLHGSLDEHAEQLARAGLLSAHAARGHLAEAAAEAERAAAAASDEAQALLMRCVASSMRYFDGESPAETSARAHDLLTASDDDEHAAWAEQALGLVAMGQGRYQESRTHMVEARRRLDRTAAPDLGYLIPHLHAPTMLAYLDDFEGQRAETRIASKRWMARGETSRMVFEHIALMIRSYIIGELDAASAEAEAALSLGAETGAGAMTIPAHAILAMVDLARGALDAAERHVSAGLEFLLSGSHRYGADVLVLAQARLGQRRGDHGAAAAVLEQFWHEAGDLVLALQYRNLVPELVRLRDHGIGADVFTAAIAATERAAERTPIESTIGCRLRCRALIDRDAEMILEAVAQYRRSPRRIERVETLEDAVNILREVGRSDDATPLAEEAVAEYEAMGATADAARAEGATRAHGASRRRRGGVGATHGWESLTAKELEVADHVAHGLSNPEIGERMFISRRTVESHLGHIFTKLGIPNRSKLTAMVVERRASTDP